MIKVGQIYKHEFRGRNILICVTRIKNNGYISTIGSDGTIGTRRITDFINYSLLSEYKTWQEAVNSKEFNEVGK